MESLHNFLKKNGRKILRFLAFFLFSLLIVYLVVLVTYLYFTSTSGSIQADNITTNGALEKRDWLTFWGSVLAVVSTTLLALITIRQNNVLKAINKEHENKDSHLLNLRFAAEFHSLIDFKAISFFKNGSNKRAIKILFISTGRMAPSKITIANMNILHGWRKNSNKIDGHQITSIQNSEMEILTNTSQDSEGKFCLVFEISESSYKKLFKTTKTIDTANEPSLRLIIDYYLTNPINVTTHVSGEMSFNHILPRDEARGDKQEGEADVVFNICESFLRIVSFDFHDSFNENESTTRK